MSLEEIKQEVKKVAAYLPECEDFLHCLDEGRVLIIDNINFKTLDERKGSDIDSSSIKRFFTGPQMKWNENNVKILSDKTVTEMVEVLEDYREKDFSKFNSFFLFILSHGSKDGICGTDGGKIHPEKIMSMFSADKCPTLAFTPKIFTFLACRGDLDDEGVSIVRDNPSQGDTSSRSLPNISEFLLLYPCAPTYTSVRNPKTGSLFIRQLLQTFSNDMHKSSIIDMLRKVNFHLSQAGILAIEPETKEKTIITIMPCQDLRLTKKCYFRPYFQNFIKHIRK